MVSFLLILTNEPAPTLNFDPSVGRFETATSYGRPDGRAIGSELEVEARASNRQPDLDAASMKTKHYVFTSIGWVILPAPPET
jgi:hypothetical protein